MRPLLLLACLGAFLSPASAQWRSGVATVDVTPEESIWLAGYAARTAPSEGVRQRLFVKALALDDGTGPAVVVTSDLIGFPAHVAAQIAEKAKREHQLSRDRLILNASHTHSGPVVGEVLRPTYQLSPEQHAVVVKYTQKLVEQVAGVIGKSLAGLAPAELAFEQGFAGFAVNRRRVGHREYPGPVDHDVPVLTVRSGGQLKAILFGYACHATVLSDNQVNGDWPGYAQAEIEQRFPGTTALFLNGASADQNPLPRRKVELARRYGAVLAEAVEQVVAGKMKPVNGPLRTAFDTVELPLRPWGRERYETFAASASAMERTYGQSMLNLLKSGQPLKTAYDYPVQAWRFGDSLLLVALAGELVSDYALRFKKEFGWDDTWVSGYNNDVFAYIPSRRVLLEGGYEGGGAMVPYGLPGPFSPAVEEMIAEKVGEVVARTAP